ncbi:PLP-dependent aspartate aminotransferase family protein, partial [uncultured Brevundimonas sp.]|uniref:trans-sulfuration enzyme family protein n=1 Tax=uncultured Brevundimonas sp. TaxID=213418 RepID=UPI00262B0759
YIVPSGLASVTVPLSAVLRPGDEVISTDAIYGPSRKFMDSYLGQRGITVRYHPAAASTQDIVALFSDKTRALLIEAPGSLTFEMADIAALAAACRERGIVSIVDNTWGAGLACRPLELGADISVQALTKYVGGHSDVLMGSICVKDDALAAAVFETLDLNGWHVSPDDAWLALRGIRTMPVRYRTQAASALKVAQWLKGQDQISRVLYPPLESDPGHHLWKQQFDGAASLIGLVMKGGSTRDAHQLMRSLELFGIGYSWGGYESLVTNDTAQLKWRVHQPELEGELIRLHIGLEDTEDLIADLARGLSDWGG